MRQRTASPPLPLASGRDRLRRLLNAESRTRGHMMLGVLLCGGAVMAALAVAARPAAPAGEGSADVSARTPASRPLVSVVVWPAFAALLAVGGMRLWNAPRSAARSHALRLWAGMQGLISSWMALRRRPAATLAAAAGSLGATADYLRSAYQVDRSAAWASAPLLLSIAAVSVLTGRRRKAAPPAPPAPSRPF